MTIRFKIASGFLQTNSKFTIAKDYDSFCSYKLEQSIRRTNKGGQLVFLDFHRRVPEGRWTSATVQSARSTANSSFFPFFDSAGITESVEDGR